MRTATSLVLSGALLGLFAAATPVAATTLTFDDIVSTPTCNGGFPAGYGGLTWSSNMQVECNADYMSTFSNSYGSPSGDYAAYNGLGAGESDAGVGAGTFTFLGASFGSFAAQDTFDTFSALSLAILGYRPGDAIGSPTFQTMFDLDPTQYVAQTVSWTGINQLAFLSGNGPVSDPGTLYGVDGWSWVMDDANVAVLDDENVAAPEPASLLLLGAGLACVALRRRHQRS